MALTLSPKEQFQTAHKPDAEEFAKVIAASRPISVALTHALAEMAMRGAAREEMHGARMFISIFLNMGEKEEKKTILPPKHLEENPAAPAQPK